MAPAKLEEVPAVDESDGGQLPDPEGTGELDGLELDQEAQEELEAAADRAQAATAAIPTREDVRARIRERLAEGTLTIEDVVADMYASQYSAELTLRQLGQFLDEIAGSKLGGRLLGGMGRKKK
jgi:hypothetical protein